MDEQTIEVKTGISQELSPVIPDGATLDSSVKITLDLGEILAEINENYPLVRVGETGSIVDTYDKLPQPGQDGELYIVKEDVNNNNLSSLYLYYNNVYKAIGNIFVAPINDNSTSNTETWSAQKINSELTNINQKVTTQTAIQTTQTQQLNSLNTVVGDLNNATTQQNYTKLGTNLIDAVHDIKNSLSNISGGDISMPGVTKSVNSIGTSTNPDYFEIDYDHQNYTKLPNVNVFKLTSDVSNTKITETFDITTNNNYENVDPNILTIDANKISKKNSLTFNISDLDSETINTLTFAKYKIPNYVDTITSFLTINYFQSIQVFYGSVFAIKTNGTLWTWGNNQYGVLGFSTNASTSQSTNYTPTQVLTNVKSIYYSNYGAYAIKNDNTLWTWGSNIYGQLGFSTNAGQTASINYTPTQVLTNVKWIQNYGGSVFVIKNDNTLWTFGNNAYGQLGFSTNATLGTSVNYTPTQVLADVQSVQNYSNSAFVIKTDGTLWTWGNNIYGQLGFSANASAANSANSTPTQILTNVQSVQYFIYGVYVIKTDGTLWTWGSNQYGQLGFSANASTSYSTNYTPTQVLTNVQSVQGSNYGIYAIKTDNTLWTWGNNIYGQLGFSANVSTSASTNYTPTQVLTNVQSVQNYNYGAVYAIKTDNTLWTCGTNQYGQLGFGTNANANASANYTFTQVLTNVKMVYYYAACVYAIKTDNTLWTWGNNIYGQLGFSTNANTSASTNYVPMQVLTNVQSVQNYNNAVYVIKTDNTLWTCGNNIYGQLGCSTNASTSYSTNYTFTQVLTNVKWIQNYSSIVFAIKIDGTLLAFGNNTYGQLALAANAGTTNSTNYIPTTVICAYTNGTNFLIKTNNKYYCQNNGILEEIIDLATISDKINNFNIIDYSLINNLLSNNSIEIIFNPHGVASININAKLKNTIMNIKEYDLSSFGSFSSLIFSLNATNVKLLLSNDSGATWNTFDGTNIFSVDITDLSAVYQKGIDYTSINVLNNNSVILDFIKTTNKLKLAVLFYDINSYIDNLTIACSFTGIWTKLVQNTDYTVNYSDKGVIVGITGTEYAKIAVS